MCEYSVAAFAVCVCVCLCGRFSFPYKKRIKHEKESSVGVLVRSKKGTSKEEGKK